MVTKASITAFLVGAVIGAFSLRLFGMIDSLRVSVSPMTDRLNRVRQGPFLDASDLYTKVRVLCWVITSPDNVNTKAVAVWNTWGKHCNKLAFVTTQPTSVVPAFVVDLPEGRDHLTGKTMQAFNHSYFHDLDDYEWFLKADDDTFIVVENLQFFLSKFSSERPSYYGYHFKVIVKQGYYSGGGGYVLSREALRRLVENGTKMDKCRLDGGAEDAEMGLCLEHAGVSTGDSRDYFGRERFHPFPVVTHLEGSYPDWYNNNAYHGAWKGLACCSDLSATFHYVTPSEMYVMDYLIYHLQVYGRKQPLLSDLNDPPPDRGVMRQATLHPT